MRSSDATPGLRLIGTYGEPFGATGSSQTPFGFTGEYTDPTTELLYLRARYYSPQLGVFTALDPLEGRSCTPMSLNGYGYVVGNPINMVDTSGMIYETPDMYASCVGGRSVFMPIA